MLKVGIIGFGFMGRMHYKYWRAIGGAEVMAVCDTNPNIIENSKKVVGNVSDAKETIDFSNVHLYSDFEEMLANERLDVVSITLPTYLHADYSVKALSAGLHVLCEKPMALTVEDCQRMIDHANQAGRLLQIGQCVRFWPEYAKAKQIVDSAEYGKVIAATFQRLGATPTWSADNWFLDERRSGGMALDLHIHDTDFVQHLFGVPQAVCSFGAINTVGQLVHIVTEYLYDDDKVITAEGSWAMMPAFGFEMSFNIVIEKATLVYDLTREPKFRICPSDGEAFTPKVEKGDGWFFQIAHFAKAVKGEEIEPIITLEQSRNSVRIVNAEKESLKKKQKVSIT